MERICFEFSEADGGSEPRLKMESSLRAHVSEVAGKEAEKVWKKIREIAGDFPEGPTIVMGFGGR
jgi:hypothetical protein